VETLAQRRAAQLFATDEVPAENIYVNIQALSGSAANLAVYDTLLEAGDTLMGMDLFQGGHLTHGSEFNLSGKRYKVVSYGVNPKTGKLDYDQMKQLALERRPKLIIGGFTSYPWSPDWAKFRQIADAVGAYLVADISHTAGMVAAGFHPTPVGIADVITFTTHKTLCGPRGAVVMTSDEEIGLMLDLAIFPGAQGGPHTNKFAAICVAFKLAQTEEFKTLQSQIVKNAQALADGLTRRGLQLAYGGTDTHLLLLDVGAIPTTTGYPLRGEMAVRILDIAGIVANKNTIPGDDLTALATGVRLGTPWLTQRGLKEKDMDTLAGLIHDIVVNIQPFAYNGLAGVLPRGKIDLEILNRVKRGVAELAAKAGAEYDGATTAYPHFDIPAEMPAENPPAPELDPAEHAAIHAALQDGAVLLDAKTRDVISVSGWRAQYFLQEVCSNNILELEPGREMRSLLLNRDGSLLDDVVLLRGKPDGRGRDRYIILTHPGRTEQVLAWFRGLADGYILFDDDIFKKVQGPVVIENLADDVPPAEQRAAMILAGPKAADLLAGLDPEIVYWGNGGGVLLVHPDDAPRLADKFIQAGATPLSPADDDALHTSTPPHLYDFTKPYFVGMGAFTDKSPAADGKVAWSWTEPDLPIQKTPLNEVHRALGGRMVPFAGWEMPVRYPTSVLEEHLAVREAAGLFDVAHMGVFEVSGPHATSFLDTVTSNYIAWLDPGQSCYTYLLDPAGDVIDDIMVYCRARDRYLMVVNAVNEAKDWDWLDAVNQRRGIIDNQRPGAQVSAQATIKNLKDPANGPECKVDIAFQGPAALPTLQSMTDDPKVKAALKRLRRTDLMETALSGIPLVIARTGYTGEDIGYEIFVHPDRAVELWNTIMEKGEPLGVKPTGLAARDSTRTEFGLPLYGHELAGPYNIDPIEAGFPGYVKYHKPFFIGREALLAKEGKRTKQVLRFRMNRKGVRVPKTGAPVLNKRGQMIGYVTSCSIDSEGYLTGLAYCKKSANQEGTPLQILTLPRRIPAGKDADKLQPGDKLVLPDHATVLTRFVQREEVTGALPGSGD